MSKFTLTEPIHVDLRVDGEDFSGDYTAGDVELPDAVADLLVAQGFATAVTGGKKKTVDPVATPTDPNPSEA